MSGLRQLLPDLQGTIFIVTYARSGSTLLQRVLNTLPHAHIAGENFAALEGLWLAATRVQRLRAEQGALPRGPDHPWFNAQAADPAAFADTLIGAFVQHVLAPPPATRWLGFKEIRHTAFGPDLAPYLDFLRTSFPNPLIVFNTRARADVLASPLWQAWDRDEIDALLSETEAGFAAFAAAHPGQTIQMDYDRWSQDPMALHPLFDRLGVPFDAPRIRALLAERLTH